MTMDRLCWVLAGEKHCSSSSPGNGSYTTVSPLLSSRQLSVFSKTLHISESDLTDINVPLESLNPTLFPGLPNGIEVHTGFASEHAKTASVVLDNVNQIISDHGVDSITLVSSVVFISST